MRQVRGVQVRRTHPPFVPAVVPSPPVSAPSPVLARGPPPPLRLAVSASLSPPMATPPGPLVPVPPVTAPASMASVPPSSAPPASSCAKKAEEQRVKQEQDRGAEAERLQKKLEESKKIVLSEDPEPRSNESVKCTVSGCIPTAKIVNIAAFAQSSKRVRVSGWVHRLRDQKESSSLSFVMAPVICRSFFPDIP